MFGFYYRWKVRRAATVLDTMDDFMKGAGYQRHEIRQFWREVSGSKDARKRLFARLNK